MKTAKEYIEKIRTDDEFREQMKQKILAAKQAGAEDLFSATSTAAKELGCEISPDQIREFSNQDGEISDEELGKIAGGTSCSPSTIFMVIGG